IRDAGGVASTALARAQPAGLLRLEIGACRAIETVAQPEIDACHALVERAELAVLTNQDFVRRACVAAIETLRLRDGGNEQQHQYGRNPEHGLSPCCRPRLSCAEARNSTWATRARTSSLDNSRGRARGAADV